MIDDFSIVIKGGKDEINIDANCDSYAVFVLALCALFYAANEKYGVKVKEVLSHVNDSVNAALKEGVFDEH